MAAERASGPLRVVDIAVTVTLVVVGLFAGLGYGFVALVFTPTGGAAIWWVVLSVLLLAVPVVTAIAGIRRLVARRTGFCMPLLGIVLVAALIWVLSLLSASLVA